VQLQKIMKLPIHPPFSTWFSHVSSSFSHVPMVFPQDPPPSPAPRLGLRLARPRQLRSGGRQGAQDHRGDAGQRGLRHLKRLEAKKSQHFGDQESTT
jgi:hypothetical protein